ncbi:MAG: hypothetical protein M3P51_12830 [Chloroflexota bacterium]|nr:hypothetical protein [Chloroflexota bacterium]
MASNERDPISPLRDQPERPADDEDVALARGEDVDPADEVPINEGDSFLTGPGGLGMTGVDPQYDPLEDQVRRTD